MIYSTKNLKIQIPIENKQRVGIRFSGGVDSSILLCILAEVISQSGSNAEIYPITIWTPHRPFNEYYANWVYEFIQDRYKNVMIHNPRVFRCSSHNEYSSKQKDAESEMYNNHNVDMFFVGVTRNPPAGEHEFSEDVWEWRDKKRDDGNTHIPEYCVIDEEGDTRNGMIQVNPLKSITKRDVREIYEHLGLLEELYPLTYSCEGYPQDNDNYQKHCGKCWWCRERIWGFGKLC